EAVLEAWPLRETKASCPRAIPVTLPAGGTGLREHPHDAASSVPQCLGAGGRDLRLLALCRPGRFRLGLLEGPLRPLEQLVRLVRRTRGGMTDERRGLVELRRHGHWYRLAGTRGTREAGVDGAARAHAGQRSRRGRREGGRRGGRLSRRGRRSR